MTYQSLGTNPYELLEKVVPNEFDYKVAFSGKVESYCIGMVDIVNSTRISAGLREDGWCKYYVIFLNSMAKILKRFGGIPIKNNGDSLLYYFPQSADRKTKYGFVSCLECSLAMIEAQKLISYTSQKNGLPSLNYRISSDYGKVTIMEPNNLSPMDVMGPPVNMCSKMNHSAEVNGIVIGGDMYEMVKDLHDYRLKQIDGYSIGLKYSYPVYSVNRKH